MKLGLILFVVALTGAIAAHFAFGLSLGLALLIFFVGWPLVGTVVTLDDDIPSGWSNSDGFVHIPWYQSSLWGQLAFGLAISAVGFAIDSGWRSATGAQYWLLAVASGFLAGALVSRKWWLAVGCLLGVGAFWL